MRLRRMAATPSAPSWLSKVAADPAGKRVTGTTLQVLLKVARTLASFERRLEHFQKRCSRRRQSAQTGSAAFLMARTNVRGYRMTQLALESHFPGGVLGGTRALAGVVFLHSLFQIGGVPAVTLTRAGDALNEVGVKHVSVSLACDPQLGPALPTSPPSPRLRRAPSFPRERSAAVPS